MDECVILRKWYTKQIFSMENSKKEMVYIGISAGIENRGSTIIDALFPIGCLETKHLYRGVLEFERKRCNSRN